MNTINHLNNAIKLAKNTNFYSRTLKDFGLIRSLEDFSKLPFTTKSDLRNNYPFELLGTSMSDVIEMHTTSGTTGKPTLSFFTKDDLELSNKYISKAWKNFGIGKKSRVQFIMSYGLFSGATLNSYAIQSLGGFILPAGIQSTQKQVELMKDFNIDVIVSTPSYFLHLYDFLKNNNISIQSLNLKVGIAAGEVYSDEIKEKISGLFDIKVYDHYGLCEVNTGIIYECDECKKMVVLKDYIYAEVVDPVSGKNLSEGDYGELVLTSIMKKASPIIRYKTGDFATILSQHSTCKKCKGCVVMSRIKGRIDSIIFYKGLKINPYELKDFVFLQAGEKVFNRMKILVTKTNDSFVKNIIIKISNKPGTDEMILKTFLEKMILQQMKVPVKVEFVSYDYFKEFTSNKIELVEDNYA